MLEYKYPGPALLLLSQNWTGSGRDCGRSVSSAEHLALCETPAALAGFKTANPVFAYSLFV